MFFFFFLITVTEAHQHRFLGSAQQGPVTLKKKGKNEKEENEKKKEENGKEEHRSNRIWLSIDLDPFNDIISSGERIKK